VQPRLGALDRERLGGLLAAVGNHEPKALTFLSLKPDVAYGITALHRRFLEIQGNRPAFKGTVTLQQKFCIYSFESIGVVARQISAGGFIRHVKLDEDGRATALAGHLLAVTERHPASLMQIFGKTATNQDHADRAPIRRLDTLRGLLATGTPVHQADLARATGLPPIALGTTLGALDRAGVVQYGTQPTYLMQSSYRATRPLERSQRRRPPDFYNSVVDHINARLEAAGSSSVDVSREEVEEHLVGDPRWAGAYIRDSLARTMYKLVARDQLRTVQDYAGQSRHTTITMDGAQERFVTDLVEGIEAIAAGDPDAHARGAASAAAIVADPARVRPLLTKAFAASKQSSNPVSGAEKQQRVLMVLARQDGLTTAEIVAALQPDLTKELTLGTLNALARAGKVSGERQHDGPYNRWHLL
jgi:hypothetical protein